MTFLPRLIEHAAKNLARERDSSQFTNVSSRGGLAPGVWRHTLLVLRGGQGLVEAEDARRVTSHQVAITRREPYPRVRAAACYNPGPVGAVVPLSVPNITRPGPAM
jgi:hypothetical protein